MQASTTSALYADKTSATRLISCFMCVVILKANHQIWTSWHAVVEALLIVLASAHRNTIWSFIMALELKCNEL